MFPIITNEFAYYFYTILITLCLEVVMYKYFWGLGIESWFILVIHLKILQLILGGHIYMDSVENSEKIPNVWG